MNIKWSILFSAAILAGCGGDNETTTGAGGSGGGTSTSSSDSTSTSSSTSATTSGGGGAGGDPVAATPEEVITKKIKDLSSDPKSLREFLVDLPKGGDLHSHISGAITTETLIQWGSQDGACVNTTTFVAAPGPCAAGAVLLSTATPGSALYKQVLSAWSMEGLAGAPLLTRHQHFFDAFGKFGAVLTDARSGEGIAELMSIAAKNHQGYLELMQGFGSGAVGNVAAGYFMPGDVWDQATLLKKRALIMADPVFATTLSKAKANLAKTTADAQAKLACGTASADPACGVKVRYLLSATRTKSREYVFGQWVLAFELAQQAPEVVGVNLVAPEEDSVSLLSYDDDMRAVDALHVFNAMDPTRKPVHVSLHAGELNKDVVPMTPEGQKELTFHIRHAVELAHAERIGHGVDVLGETEGNGANGLLAEMSAQGVLVELCLTSNAALLNASGMLHPFHAYMDHGVPVTLATDDEGILRVNVTDEYTRAVLDLQADYPMLKTMARASIEHSFLPGGNLWNAAGKYTVTQTDCAQDTLGAKAPSMACATYLKSSERAAQQWQVEAEIAAFETANAAP